MSEFTPQQVQEIIDEYIETTGTRQYIGARYVPVFGRKEDESIEWDNSAPYEPLTIVLYQGASYTSRTYVPTGVPITDTKYWACTGNYNAQVEAYRQEVQSIVGEIDAVVSSVGEMQTALADEISARGSADSAIRAELADEISARGSADSSIRDAIAAETRARTSADSATDTRIDAIEANYWVTSERIANDAVTADKLNRKSFVAAYRSVGSGAPNEGSRFNICISNDGVNWDCVKQHILSTLDACNIQALPDGSGYMLLGSWHAYRLDNDFNVTADYGDIPFNTSLRARWWGANFFFDDDGSAYVLATGGDNVTTSTYTGTYDVGNFGPYIAPVTFTETTMTVGTFQPVQLVGGTGSNHIDMALVTRDGTYYLGVKDETECTIEVYTSTNLLGPYTRRWTNPHLHGIEAPKLLFDDTGKLIVYFSAYNPTVTDMRTNDSYTSANTSETFTCYPSIFSNYYGGKFAGFYSIDVSSWTESFINFCGFSFAVPRHFGVCQGNKYYEQSINNEYTIFFNDQAQVTSATEYDSFGCTYTLDNTAIEQLTNPGNIMIKVPALGKRSQICPRGIIPAGFSGKIAIVTIPVDSSYASIPIDMHVAYADRRTNKGVYVGGIMSVRTTAREFRVSSAAAIETPIDRRSYDNIACVKHNWTWYPAGAMY